VPISARHMEVCRGLVARPQRASAAVKMPFLRWGHACSGYSEGEGFVRENMICIWHAFRWTYLVMECAMTNPHTPHTPVQAREMAALILPGGQVCISVFLCAPFRAALSLARSVALSCRSQRCKHGRRLACIHTVCCEVLFGNLTGQ